MEVLRIIAATNNQGVDLLISNHIDDAMRSFKVALRTAKDLQQDPRDDPHHEEAITAAIDNFHEFQDIATSEQDLRFATDSQGFVFSRPFRIVMPPIDAADNQQGNNIGGVGVLSLETITSVVIYNMALLYHYMSYHRAEESQILQRSLALYGMCRGLTSQPSQRLPSLRILETLCLNNTSQILYDQGDYTTVMSYLCRASAEIQSRRNEYSLLLGETEIQGCLLNILFLQPPAVAHAA